MIRTKEGVAVSPEPSTSGRISEIFDVNFLWKTFDPFIIAVHHIDTYPAGTSTLGPTPEELESRTSRPDFDLDAAWHMYQGATVPGFPRHPHRGFETISYVRRGLMDHADSLGASARFGPGDLQWITAGRGVQHAEMFPLLDQTAANPMEVLQIWLNPPAVDKMDDPVHRMFWSEDIPCVVFQDAEGRTTRVLVLAGSVDGVKALDPPPSSWASRSEADLAIWHVHLDAAAEWTLPQTDSGATRAVYVIGGDGVDIAGTALSSYQAATVDPTASLTLSGLAAGSDVLVLQSCPIAEPVEIDGGFVMNTQAELDRARHDYEQTEFGPWPWDSTDPNHGADARRFSVYPDGQREEPQLASSNPDTTR
jgi:redox-sensitive bicupin YhaK (pirin superfamily)